MRSLFSKAIMAFVVVAVFIAIWRANDGDMGKIAAAIMVALNYGADFVTTIWTSLFGR